MLSLAKVFSTGPRPKRSLLALRTLGVALYLIQPLARLSGRVGNGLTPWRRRGTAWVFPRRRRLKMMTEFWVDPAQRLHVVEAAVRSSGAVAMHGGEYDCWDLEIRGGIMQGRAVTAAEIESLATLPPEEVFRGQVLGAIVAPLTTLAGLLNAPLQNLVGFIDARIEQLGGEEAPAEEAPAEEAPAEEEPVVEESSAEDTTQADATASAAEEEEES